MVEVEILDEKNRPRRDCLFNVFTRKFKWDAKNAKESKVR